MSRGPDACTLLERALIAAAGAGGCEVTIPASHTQRWASATFIGARHMLTLTSTVSARFDAWIAGLPEHEFTLRGHLVADLVVTSTSRDGAAITARLEVLTVEER